MGPAAATWTYIGAGVEGRLNLDETGVGQPTLMLP